MAVPEDGQFFRILEGHKANLEAARARKGEIPTDHQSRQAQIEEHMTQYESLSAEKAAGREKPRLQSTIIGEPYLPSVAPVQALEKIMIKELKLETHHRGRYMLLRMVVPPVRMNAVISLAEDEDGDVSTFSLYMQDPESVQLAARILKKQAVILLKEPYFKVTGGGGYGIRVDHPTDVVWLPDDDSKVPNPWRITSRSCEKTAEGWKQDGNSLMNAGKYREAIDKYSMALKSTPTPAEAEVIHNNRALSYLKIGKFDAALKDVTSIGEIHVRSEKALYRGALALYGLHKFTECHEMLESLLSRFPGSAAGKYELALVKNRIQEQNEGKYNFKKMYQQSKLRPPIIDSATFVGPVQIRSVTGKGRALFTSRAVKCGDLLACEKAFSYGYAEPPGSGSSPNADFGVLINLTTNRVKLGTDAAHISSIYRKLVYNPSMSPRILDLCHGSYDPVPIASVDGMPVIDSFLIERIVSLNTFGCPVTSKDQELSRQQSGEASKSSGIWPLAAYINHSCIANCARTFIGDMLIMRAARDLLPNTELTWCYHDPTDRASIQKSLLGHWGLECSCPVCVEEANTEESQKKQRRQFLARINRTHMADSKLFSSIDSLYASPAKNVPRYEVFRCYYSAAMYWFRSKYDPPKVVMFAAKALEALGFEMNDLREDGSRLLVQQHWGVPIPEVTRLWELLAMFACHSKGNFRMAKSAMKHWKLAYSIIEAGEDETFEESCIRGFSSENSIGEYGALMNAQKLHNGSK